MLFAVAWQIYFQCLSLFCLQTYIIGVVEIGKYERIRNSALPLLYLFQKHKEEIMLLPLLESYFQVSLSVMLQGLFYN